MATALALLLVTSVFGSIGVTATTGETGSQAPVPMGGDSDPAAGMNDTVETDNGSADLIATLDRIIAFLTDIRNRLAAIGGGDTGGTPGDTTTDVPETGTGAPSTGTDTPGTTTGVPGETTTDAPTETTDSPNETTTDTPTETTTTETPTETPAEPPENASVVFDDQTSSGQQVTVAEAALPEAGEVRITDAGGNVLGSTELPAGENTDIPIQLDPPLTENQTLTADLFDSQGNALGNASGETATDTADVTVPVVGATRAPDLVDIADFRNGTTTDGRSATLADFTFDQPVDVTGGASNFNLVPINNSGDPTALDGTGEIVEINNDTVTVAFIDDRAEPEGPFTQDSIARGFVDANTVQPPNVSGTANPLEAEPVNNDGNSESPDVLSIERNVLNNSLIFEFDEPVTVSDTSGFNYYAQDGSEISSVDDVIEVDNTTLEVRFTTANPVANAVGGSVESNAVVGNDGGEDANLPDEELITSEGGTNTSSMGNTPLATGGVLTGLAAMSVLMIRRRR